MAGSSGSHWQCQLATSGERLALLRESGLLSDISITFPGQQRVLQAHRLVLSMSSPVFEAMLCGPLAEGDILHLPEDPPEAFEWVLNHLYRDLNQLPSVLMAIKIYQLASKYQLDVLCEICSDYLVGEVNAENFPLVFDTAVLLDDGHLLNRCGEIIAVSADDVLTSADIYLLRRSSLRSLLRHHDLAPSSEVLVFRALLRWGEKKLEDSDAPSNSQQPPLNPLSTTPQISAHNQLHRVLGEPKNVSRSDAKRTSISKSSEGQSFKGEETSAKCYIEPAVVGPQQRRAQESLPCALRSELEDLLPHVKFMSLTTDEFVMDVLPSSVLTNEESVAMLMNIKEVPNVPLPAFMASQDKIKRKNRVKSATLMFCQHHFGINDQEILGEFHVSKPIFVSRITAPAVMSKINTGVTILATSPFSRVLVRAKWQGNCCKLEKPVELVPAESYSVVVASAYGPCSGCKCDVSSNSEGLCIIGKTLGLSPVYLDFWEAD